MEKNPFYILHLKIPPVITAVKRVAIRQAQHSMHHRFSHVRCETTVGLLVFPLVSVRGNVSSVCVSLPPPPPPPFLCVFKEQVYCAAY